MSLYSVLGLQKEATQEQIKHAYRSISKQCHPDAGGNEEDFKRLSNAYEILSDPEKRARYDRGESQESINKAQPNEQIQIRDMLIKGFLEKISVLDPDRHDIFKALIKDLKSAQAKIVESKNQVQAAISKVESAIKRIKNPEPENVFVMACTGQIAQHRVQIENLEVQLSIVGKAQKFLEDFSYEVQEQPDHSHGLQDLINAMYGSGGSFR